MSEVIYTLIGMALPGAALEEDIRGPRPAVQIPIPPESHLGLWIALTAGVLAVMALCWWLLRRRKSSSAASVSEHALTQLDAINRERISLEAAPLADRTADVVRKYIAGKFGIAAPQRTTEEFLTSLTVVHSPLIVHRELLQGFLTSCDMAKFAGASFNNAERLALVDNAYRFIRASAHSDAGTSTPGNSGPAA